MPQELYLGVGFLNSRLERSATGLSLMLVVKRRLKHGRDRTVLLQEKWGKKERSEGKQPGLPLGRLYKGQVLAAKNQRAVFVT